MTTKMIETVMPEARRVHYPVSMPRFIRDWMPDNCSAFFRMTTKMIETVMPEARRVRYPVSMHPFVHGWTPDRITTLFTIHYFQCSRSLHD